MISAHELHLIIGWPSSLSKTETSLDALQEFPRNLVAHDMCLIVGFMQLFSGGSLMDTNHSYANWPCPGIQISNQIRENLDLIQMKNLRFANTQPQIPVVSIHISSLLRTLDNLHHWLQHTLLHVPLFELLK